MNFYQEETKRKYVAIDIGSKSIQAVVGSFSSDVLEIDSLQKINIPDNIESENEIQVCKGYIRKLIEENGIQEKETILTIESPHIIKREILLPGMEAKKVSQEIAKKMQEHLPLDIKKYKIQYKEIKKCRQEGQEKIQWRAYAMPIKLIEEYVHMIKEVGLVPVVLDIQSNAIEKVFTEHPINEESDKTGQIAMVDIGDTGLKVSIFKNGKHVYTDFVQAPISIGKLLKEKNSLVTEKTAEAIINRFSRMNLFSRNLDKAFLFVQEAVIDIGDTIAEELLKVFQKYSKGNSENTMDKIYTYGGGAQIKNIDLYIGARTKIPTEHIKSIGNVEVAEAYKKEKLTEYVNSIGALVER